MSKSSLVAAFKQSPKSDLKQHVKTEIVDGKEDCTVNIGWTLFQYSTVNNTKCGVIIG
jgi:hypothetical protein